MKVPVRLDSPEPSRRCFLSDHEVVVVDGGFAPIEYEGHRFVFSHKVTIGGYHADTEDEALVFTEHAAG